MSGENNSEVMRALGRIEGGVEGIQAHLKQQDGRLDRIDKRLDGQDARLRTLETKAAVSGAVSGGAMSVGMALVIEGIKQWMSRPGS